MFCYLVALDLVSCGAIMNSWKFRKRLNKTFSFSRQPKSLDGASSWMTAIFLLPFALGWFHGCVSVVWTPILVIPNDQFQAKPVTVNRAYQYKVRLLNGDVIFDWTRPPNVPESLVAVWDGDRVCVEHQQGNSRYIWIVISLLVLGAIEN